MGFPVFIQVVKLVHQMVWQGDMSDGENLLPCVRMHKAEVRTVMGYTWWSKACSSDRQAVVLVDENRKRQKQQMVYMYLGGGSLSAESTEDMQGSVARCKTWNLASSVARAGTLSDCPQPPSLGMRSRPPTCCILTRNLNRT